MADFYKKYKNIANVTLIVFTLIASLYAGIRFSYSGVCFFVDKRIDKQTEPILRALEFQTLIITQTLPDSVYNNIVRIWKNSNSIIPEK